MSKLGSDSSKRLGFKLNEWEWAFQYIEPWLIMLAVENHPPHQVREWRRPQWDNFYKRFNKSEKKSK
jgi:hypothetical protein